jgi:hypothetical protein
MTRFPAFLLFLALLAVPATAQARTITIVKPAFGHDVPVLVDTAPKPQVTLDTMLITVNPVDEDCCYDPPSGDYDEPSEEPGGSDPPYPSDEPGGSDEPTNPASDDPSDWGGNPLIP